mmetsp:Transcript_14262/g.28771  ORF Transcript_14262/g.28771 Transcript_14262/m.28771 type:complete len:215 (+) Transcript_14262:591-1235(+)
MHNSPRMHVLRQSLFLNSSTSPVLPPLRTSENWREAGCASQPLSTPQRRTPIISMLNCVSVIPMAMACPRSMRFSFSVLVLIPLLRDGKSGFSSNAPAFPSCMNLASFSESASTSIFFNGGNRLGFCWFPPACSGGMTTTCVSSFIGGPSCPAMPNRGLTGSPDHLVGCSRFSGWFKGFEGASCGASSRDGGCSGGGDELPECFGKETCPGREI